MVGGAGPSRHAARGGSRVRLSLGRGSMPGEVSSAGGVLDPARDVRVLEDQLDRVPARGVIGLSGHRVNDLL